MKRILSLLITVTLIFLCGCEKHSDYKEIEDRLFVSALGIDETASGITVYAEGAVSNIAGEGYEVSIISYTAETIPLALDGIKKSTPLSLDLSHCAVIIIGKRRKNTEKKLCEYLLSRPEDALSCYFVVCDSAKDLIERGNETPLGYALSYALKKNYYAGNLRTPARLLDILNYPEAFYLPYFSLNQNSYLYSGAAYYSGVKRVALKSAEESRLIALLSGNFFKGQITVEDSSFNIKSTNFSQKVKGDKIDIVLSIKVEGGAESVILENQLLRVLTEWQNDYRLNIFKYASGGRILTNSEFCAKKINLTLKLKEASV